MIYRAFFYIPRDIEDAWIECQNIRLTYRFCWENGATMLCRVLKAAGHPDGEMVVTQTGTRPQYALVHNIKSMYQQADYRLFSNDDIIPIPSAALYADLCQVSWAKIQDQHGVLARDFVLVSGDTVTLTEAGRTAKTNFETGVMRPKAVKADSPTEIVEREVEDVLPDGFYANLQSVLAGDSLRPRSIAALLARRLVTMEGETVALTALATQKMTEYEATKADRDAERQRQRAEREARRAMPRVTLSEQQRESFRIATTVAYRWHDMVPTRTRTLMIREGWIAIEDGMPVLTKTGRAVYGAARQMQAA
jgi:hypothetical protein